MATATKKSRAVKQPAARTARTRVPESMEFFMVEDNSGSYHWTIVDKSGRRLARSDRFASYDEADHAARAVRVGAGASEIALRGADSPDAGGSYAVTR